LRDYEFVEVPENVELRTELSEKSIDELANILLSLRKVHNKTDLIDRSRLLRAIEIEQFNKKASHEKLIIHNSMVFGVLCPREIVRSRIANRLKNRMDEGMIDEIKRLMNEGVSIERLLSFGLEYKFVTLYLTDKLSKDEMENLLCIAIQQFSKRQMSWFRRMERLGVKINWIDGMLSEDEKVNEMMRLLK
jgi:tRNA dimethylallyltransferase